MTYNIWTTEYWVDSETLVRTTWVGHLTYRHPPLIIPGKDESLNEVINKRIGNDNQKMQVNAAHRNAKGQDKL